MNPYEKLPYDFTVKVENETMRRIAEFAKTNKEIYDKFSYIDKVNFENWVATTVTYEFYRLYEITEEELKNYGKKEETFKFVNLK